MPQGYVSIQLYTDSRNIAVGVGISDLSRLRVHISFLLQEQTQVRTACAAT